MSEIIRAVQTDILFGNALVDAYKLQNSSFEKRLGMAGISESLGYSKEWFGRLPKQAPKQFKSLQSDGFTGCHIEVRVPQPNGKRGASIAKTVSIRDFNKLLAYEAIKKKNIKSIILLVALSEAGLERVISDAFNNVSLAWFAEKVIHYTKWTYDDLQEALACNREDLRDLYAWADDPIDEVEVYSRSFPPSLEL